MPKNIPVIPWMLVSELQKTSVSPQRVFKVVFLGSSGVGKTSFIRRFCTGQPQERVNATVGELCFHSHSVFSVTETRKEAPGTPQGSTSR